MKKNSIWAKDDSMNQTYIFVKRIDSPIKQKLNITISASDFYKIFINGKTIIYGPYRTEKKYISNDKLSIETKKGENIIAVIVQHYGACCFSTQKREPFFSISVKGVGIDLSEKDFVVNVFKERIKKSQRYSYQRGFSEIYKFDKDFDEILLDYLHKKGIKPKQNKTQTIIQPVFDLPVLKDKINASLLSSGKFKIDTKKKLWEDRSIYQVGDNFEGFFHNELEECISDTVGKFAYSLNKCKRKKINRKSFSTYFFPREITGFINLKLKVIEDCDLYITFDELLQENKTVNPFRLDCCNVIKYTLKKGEYTIENLEPYSFRYITLNVTKGSVIIKKVSSLLVENKKAYTIKFKINNKKIQNICKSACYTLAQNTWDYVSDCPSRERACWLNDLYYTKDSVEMFFGNTDLTYASIRNYLLNENNNDLPKGVIPMCFPSNFLNGEYVPNILMWFILITCDLIKKKNIGGFYDQAKEKIYSAIRFLDSFLNEDGLLENLKGWVFIEWSSANRKDFVCGVNYPSNMLYVKALEEVGLVYKDKVLLKRSKVMSDVILKQSFNGEFFEDNMVRNSEGDLVRTGNISEVCQYYAFFSGIASKERFSALYEKLKNVFVPTRVIKNTYPTIDKANIITGILERANILLKYGERKQVLQEMIDVYSNMAETNFTLWEKTSANASCNHAVASYGGYIIIKALTGFKCFKKNGISFYDDYVKDYNYKICLPFKNKVYIVRVRNGKRTIKIKNI